VDWLRDRFGSRQFHLPRPKNVFATAAIAGVVALAGIAWFARDL
jgi:hypothetical protein